MTEEEVFEQLRESKGVPALPQVLAQVIRVATRDESTPKELADVISKDAALTARLLRIVNSPYYKRTHKISTVNHTVTQLGPRAVMAIALSSGVYRMFENQKSMIDRIAFWTHSMETAIACREIAKICNYQPAEEAFVLGLMHDLSILVLESAFPEKFKKIWERVEAGEDLVRLEQAALGTNHTRVGKFLLDLWKLPEFMGEAIAQHHDELSPQDQAPQSRLGRIVNLGNMISESHTPQMEKFDRNIVEKNFALAESLGISPIALAELQAKTQDMLLKESEFLDIRIGPVSELLESANHLIYKQYLLVEKLLNDIHKMQDQIAQEKMKKAALGSLKTITATLSHYINNDMAVIMSGAERVQRAISKGNIIDSENIASKYLENAINSVEKIGKFFNILKEMSVFDTSKYTDDTSILDIGDQLKARIEAIDKE
jgi:HD-like signal output (HDOD) protein